MTSATVVTRDPDSGVLNGGTYRGMITGKNTIGVLLAMTQGWGKHFSKYKNRGQEMPVAVVIGWDQTLVSRRSTPVNYPEYEMAGSLRGAPVELVKCELSDLLVPASAEIVLEGFVSPDPKHLHFGRTVQRISRLLRRQQVAQAHDPRRMHHPSKRSDLSRLSYRRKPGPNQRRHDLDAGDVFGDGLALPRTGRRAEHHRRMARQMAGDACACRFANRTAATRSKWPPRCGAAIWATMPRKHVIVVDDDIDIHDWEAIEWALCYRVNAGLGRHFLFRRHERLDARSERASGRPQLGQIRPRSRGRAC